MKSLSILIKANIQDILHSRWFLIYSVIFGGAIVLLFALGITESQVLGFSGLTRLLIIYIQLCIAVLPIFILISTVRSLSAEREHALLEYWLSMPISLFSYFWSKVFSRFIMILIPTVVAIFGAAIWGLITDLNIPWSQILYYIVLLISLVWCFLCIGIFLSVVSHKQEVALGLALFIWLLLLLFIDAIMIGVMLQQQFDDTWIILISLLNPMQAFRTAAILLFDPEFTVIGPAAYVILEIFGKTGFLVFCTVYPFLLGWLFSIIGYFIFNKKDIV